MFAMFTPTPDVVDRDGAQRFVDALGQTSAAVWLQAAAADETVREARARVLDVILAHAERLSVHEDLWRVADLVETVAWYALPGWCRAPRTAAAAAIRHEAVGAARLAAYAILLRALLSETEFDLACAPFQQVARDVRPDSPS